MGDHLELNEEATAGDFIYVPPYVPHQEINGSFGGKAEVGREATPPTQSKMTLSVV
jgi:uncharacterized RmlC-like cupin family protein